MPRRTAYFVDISASMSANVLDFATGLALGFRDAYALDAGGVYVLDASFREDILTRRVPGGSAVELAKDPSYDDLDKVLLTDGDVPDSLAVCFDVVMVVKDKRDELVREVMTT